MISTTYQDYLNIKNDRLYEVDASGLCHKSLGIAGFLKMTYDGIDLNPLLQSIEEEIEKNPHNAAALLDSSSLMFIKGTNSSTSLKYSKGKNVYAFQRQQAAFDQTVFFKICESSAPALRVLALAAPGDITCNAPLEFLLRKSDIDLTFWYVLPDGPEVESVPEHDIAIVAASLSDATKPSTDRIQKILQNWPKPVINRIENVQKFQRDQLFTFANKLPGIYVPETKMILRSEVTEEIGSDIPYPFIIRPADSHGGQGLTKIDQFSDLMRYLKLRIENEFFVTTFVDFSSEDGLFRKYRIAVIDGKSFPFHMAVSEKWGLWYYDAGMATDEKKLAEENDFIINFDQEFGEKYGDALRQMAEETGSEYFVLDCAKTKKGELLIFEAGHDMVVHDMDTPVLFPVKTEHVKKLFRVKNENAKKVFRTFQTMLKSHANVTHLQP